jgi:hypothetical protein
MVEYLNDELGRKEEKRRGAIDGSGKELRDHCKTLGAGAFMHYLIS